MRASKELIKEVTTLARDELLARGYEERSDGIFTLDIAAEVNGWIGLNRAVNRGDGQLEIHPFIGIRHQLVERKLAEIRGEKFHPYSPPTIRSHLQYLMPEGSYEPWLFGEEVPVKDRLRKMVADIDTFGNVFMREHTGLEALARCLEDRLYSHPESRAFRLPIIYLLLGSHELSLGALDESLADLGDRSDLAAVQYREFAHALREVIDPLSVTDT